MPASGPVSITRQTIYCFIPIMDLYAAYHIKKLRWYLLIFLGVTTPLGIAIGMIYPIPEIDEYDQKLLLDDQEIDWSYAVFGDEPEKAITLIIIQKVIEYGLAVYLIRRWSKKWNLQFT